MFGSVILDVGVGLVLIYLLFSLVSASIREWLASVLKTRSTTLEHGMVELLHDPKLVTDFYNHPIINSLYRGTDYATAKKKRQLPSYIPAKSFSAALVDMIVRGRDAASAIQGGPEARALTTENVRAQIARLGDVRVQRVVLAAVDDAAGDMAALRAGLEHWFDSTMDRVSGWYKSHTQIYVFIIGLLLVIVADADSFAIARRLYRDPALRQQAVAIAGNAKLLDSTGDGAAQLATQKLDSLGLPLMGWERVPVAKLTGLEKAQAYGGHAARAFIGWLITAFAISLGAPFWFDTLGRIMVIRNTVKPNQKSPNEASDDRQADAPAAGASSVRLVVAAETPPATSGAPRPSGGGDVQQQEWAAGHPQGGIL